MTPNEARQVLRLLLAGWPSQRLDQESVVLYATALERHDFEVGHRAALALVESEQFFPPLSVLLGQIRALGPRHEYVGELDEGSDAYAARAAPHIAGLRGILDSAPSPACPGAGGPPIGGPVDTTPRRGDPVRVNPHKAADAIPTEVARTPAESSRAGRRAGPAPTGPQNQQTATERP